MPHHWFRVVPDARGPKVQEERIKQVVRSHGGRLLYVGFDEQDRCHVLINMTRVKDPKKLRAALKAAAGKDLVFETRSEREKRKKRR